MLELRQIERSDLSLLRDWRNSIEIRSRCREYRLLNMLDQEQWWEAVTRDPDTQMFGIIYDSELIGVCGLTYIHWANRTAEISIYVGNPDYVRKGVGIATLALLRKIAFQEYNLHRLWAEIYSFNHASIKLFEKSGYVLEGTMREHVFWEGRYWDSLMYGLVEKGK